MSWWSRFMSNASQWRELRFNATLALGDKRVATTHGGITWTLPSGGSFSSNPNEIWMWNFDVTGADPITVKPPSGGSLYIDGATLGPNNSYVMAGGEMVIAVAVGSNVFFLKKI